MIATLWAEEIMKKETEKEKAEIYKRVPRLLKEKVKSILIEAEIEEMAEE